ncbi:MAG: hypothetical protein Q9227_005914 [Pyrenula ochraceoflavens]
MLFGMETGIIGGVLTLDPFEAKYGLTDLSKVAKANLSANIVSTLQAGCFAGALIASPVSDRWGRKPALLISAVFAFIGSMMQTGADGHLAALYVGRYVERNLSMLLHTLMRFRFITGLGVGAASMVNPLYISENAPRAIRGGLTGLYQLFIVFGVMLAFWINYGCLLHLSGKAQYIVPLSMQGLPAVLLFVCMSLCNESPRWLAKQDRWEAAKSTLSHVRNLPATHPYVENEFTEICAVIERERLLIGGASFWNLQKEMWTIAGNRKRAIISITLMICQQMTGTNAINYYAPQIFENLGINGNTTGLFATGVYGIVKTVACAVFLLIAADSLGRRRSLLWTSIAQGLAMFYIGLYVRIAPPVKGQPVPGAGYFALVCIFLFAGFFQFGWGPVCWIYVSEIPTARLRAQNVALAAATQWLFNFVVARAVPNMLATVGAHGYGTYLIFGCFCFSMFVFVWFFIPETKGMSLEKMDDLFGVTGLVEKKVEQGEIDIERVPETARLGSVTGSLRGGEQAEKEHGDVRVEKV